MTITDLSKKTIDKNLEHLKYLQTKTNPNQILNKALKGEKSFVQEVNDLFYFFEKPISTTGNLFKDLFKLKCLLKLPKFRDNHDERLNQLEEVLSEVDLMTTIDSEKYKLVRTLSKINSLDERMMGFEIKPDFKYKLPDVYKGLKGPSYTEEMRFSNFNLYHLDKKGLQEYLLDERKKRMTDSLIVASVLVYFSGSILATTILLYTDSTIKSYTPTNVLFGLSYLTGLYLLFKKPLKDLKEVYSSIKKDPAPNSYYSLKIKAERMDDFISEHIRTQSSLE